MSEPFDYSAAQQRIWASLDKKEYLSVADELKRLISFLEVSGATEYIDYVEYKFLLHQVYAELKDWQSSIEVLRELNSHFLLKTDPRMLTPRGVELYIKSWTYLGYLLSETGQIEESLRTFRRCLPLLVLLRGLESQEVETVKWYILSVRKEGRISSDEPESFLSDDSEEEGLRCSFCLTGQVDIVTGPSVYICRNCINLFNEFRDDVVYTMHLCLACGDSRCSFGCKAQPSTSLFPGPGVFICADCLSLCDKLGEERTLPISL